MSLESPTAVADANADPAAPPAARRAVPWVEAWAAVAGLAAAVATAGLFVREGGSQGLFVPALCFGMVLLAAGFDAATGRIPNPLTYTGILLGFGLNALGVVLAALAPRLAAHWLGAAGPTQSALGLLVFGGIGLFCLILAGMGGGDMKLLAAVGAMLGLSQATDALLCALAVAVVYSVVNLLIRGRLNATARAAAVQLLNLVYLRDLTPTAPASRKSIPLSVPILLGLILSRVPGVAAATGWLRGVS